MSMFDIRVGDRKTVYDDTDYTTNLAVPRVGRLEWDPDYNAFFRFLKNTGASALTAGLVAVSSATDKSLYNVALAAATDDLANFAGVTVQGCASCPQNSYAWFQVSGQATFIHSGGTATAADGGIGTAAAVAGKVKGSANTAAGVLGAFANAEAVVSVLDTLVKGAIVRSVQGP